MNSGGALHNKKSTSVSSVSSVIPTNNTLQVQKQVKPLLKPVKPVVVDKQEKKNSVTLKELQTMYPNHLTLVNKDKNLYVTPALIKTIDLNLVSLDEFAFGKIFDFISKSKTFSKLLKNMDTINKEDVYKGYRSIVDVDVDADIDAMNSIFIINLFELLNSNSYESCVTKTMYFNGEDQGEGELMKGGQKGGWPKWLSDRLELDYASGGREHISDSLTLISIFTSVEAINMVLGSPLNLSMIMVVTILIYCIGIRRVTRTSRELIRRVVPRNIRYPRFIQNIDVDSVTNYFSEWNCKLSDTISLEIRQQFAKYSSRSYLESTKIKSIKYETLKQAIITFQTGNGYITGDNGFQIQTGVMEDVPFENQAFTPEKLATFIKVDGENIMFTEAGIATLNLLNKPQRLHVKGLLTPLVNALNGPAQNKKAIFLMTFKGLNNAGPVQQREVLSYKTVACPSCSKHFCYNADDTYIHEKLDDGEVNTEIDTRIAAAGIAGADIDVTRAKIKGEIEYCSKLNIFPCKQLIDSLSDEKKLDPRYIFNSRFGEQEAADAGPEVDAEPGADDRIYGSKLLCSNCCLDVLTHIDEGVWPLYFGALADKTTIGDTNFELVEELASHLSPVELKTVYTAKYNSNALGFVKLKQAKETHSTMKEVSDLLGPNATPEDVMNEMNVVQCQICPREKTGRLFKVFKKKSIELLYLHCSTCNTNYNGCDYRQPYILKKDQFERYLKSETTCKFIADEKLLLRRQAGMVRVSMEKYKEIKRSQIAQRYTDEIAAANPLKHCPRCNVEVHIEAGCSCMQCGECGIYFCYVCCQQTREKHDNSHMLVNTETPYGGYFSLQCINSNFSIIDPDGNRGIYPEIRHNQREVRPNPAFTNITRINWKKWLFLQQKYRRIREGRDIVREIGQDRLWTVMESLRYNARHDCVYEEGDPQYDPDVHARVEIDAFLDRCNDGMEIPILEGRFVDVADVIAVEGEDDDEALPPPPQGQPQPPLPPPQEQQEVEFDINIIDEDERQLQNILFEQQQQLEQAQRQEQALPRRERALPRRERALYQEADNYNFDGVDMNQQRLLLQRAEALLQERQQLQEQREREELVAILDPHEVAQQRAIFQRIEGQQREREQRERLEQLRKAEREQREREQREREQLVAILDPRELAQQGALFQRIEQLRQQQPIQLLRPIERLPQQQQPRRGRIYGLPLDFDHDEQEAAQPQVRRDRVEQRRIPLRSILDDDFEAQMQANRVFANIGGVRRPRDDDQDYPNKQPKKKGGGTTDSPILQLIPFTFKDIHKESNFQSITIQDQTVKIKSNLDLLEQQAIHQNPGRYAKLLEILEKYTPDEFISKKDIDSVVKYIKKEQERGVLLPYEISPLIREQISISIICRTIDSLKEQEVTHICIYPSEFGYFPLFKRKGESDGKPTYTCLNYFIVDIDSDVEAEMKCVPLDFDSIHKMVTSYNRTLELDYNLSTILNDTASLEYIFKNFTEILPSVGGKYYNMRKLTKKNNYMKKIDKKKQKKTMKQQRTIKHKKIIKHKKTIKKN